MFLNNKKHSKAVSQKPRGKECLGNPPLFIMALVWNSITMCGKNADIFKFNVGGIYIKPASWLGGQNFWLLTMKSRVRFPFLSWEFAHAGEDPHSDHGLDSL
jgi:hypothetical protein